MATTTTTTARLPLQVSVREGEIVPASRTISVVAATDLDEEAIEGGIAVRDRRGRPAHGVTVLEGDRLSFVADEGLRPGRQELVVDELVDRRGERLTKGLRISFTVVDTPVDVGEDVAIESLVRLVLTKTGTRRVGLDERPRSGFVDVVKGEHRESGEPVRLAVDQDGERVDLAEHERAVAKRRAEELGRVHPDLAARFEQGEERVPVAVWLRTEVEQERFRVMDRLRHEIDRGTGTTAADADRSRSKDRGDEVPRVVAELRDRLADERRRGVDLVAEYSDEVRPDRLAPVVYATLDRKAATALARRDDVAGVFLHDPTGVDDLDDSIEIAGSDHVHSLGVTGDGVRVAVFERGPDDTSDLDVVDVYDSTPSTSDHSRHVHGIIKNVEAGQPNGHAPDCDLYSANDYDLAALAWAVDDANCRIINQSFHRTSEATGGSLSYDDLYKDWLTMSWPWPLLVQAAGNTGESGATISPSTDEYVNHKTYNHLVVGNHDDAAGAMSSSTVFRNPTSSHGDRELPELAANGTGVTTVGLTKSGTSMASPAVAGVAALMQSRHSSLKTWPEALRAVLLAGATRNVRDDTWWDDVVANVDAYDGSGAVNAQESDRVAQVRASRNGTPSQRGWDGGTLRSSDLDGSGLSTFSYRVQVPGSRWWFLGPRKVKVALCWDSEVTEIFGLPLSSQLENDLDIKVFDSNGTQVGYSGSWDNSYEIAEFTGTPGETYDIHIRRWSGNQDTWYGVAWTVTGGLLISDEWFIGPPVVAFP